MRRFIRSMLAVEVGRRAALLTRVQARWRGLLARRSLDARLLRARLRLRWLSSSELLLLSAAPAQRPAGLGGGRVHAVARGFLVRRRVARYTTHRRAACLLQAAARGSRDRRTLRLPLAQHRRWLCTAAALEEERHARLTQEGALCTLYQAIRGMLETTQPSVPPPLPPVSAGPSRLEVPPGPSPVISSGPPPAASPVPPPAAPPVPPPSVSPLCVPPPSVSSLCVPPPSASPLCVSPPAVSPLRSPPRAEAPAAAGDAAGGVGGEPTGGDGAPGWVGALGPPVAAEGGVAAARLEATTPAGGAAGGARVSSPAGGTRVSSPAGGASGGTPSWATPSMV